MKGIVWGIVFIILAGMVPAFVNSPTPHPADISMHSPEQSTIVSAQNEIESLRAFAKTYGYIRYFHPSDEASEIDWERLAIHGAGQVRTASTESNLRSILESLFHPIAPTVQFYNTEEPDPSPSATLLPSDTSNLQLVFWQHKGIGQGNQGPYRSIRINRKSEGPPIPQFGTMAQNINAIPLRGKQIKMRASVRTKLSGNGNQAQLWLRVDRPNRQMGFFDNMANRPITSPEWSDYEIEGDVAEDAENIMFGAMLFGQGTAWMDNFQFFSRSSADQEWQPVTITNPDFEQDQTGVQPSQWFAQSPGYTVEVVDEDAVEGAKSAMVQSMAAPRFANQLFDTYPDPGQLLHASLGQDLHIQLPLVLYSQDEKTMPKADPSALSQLQGKLEEIDINLMSSNDAELRIGGIIIAWNVFQHFYPYFDVVQTDWDQVLTQTLQRTLADQTPMDYLQTLRWMVAHLHDGHGGVYNSLLTEYARPPFLVDQVEDKIVIVALAGQQGSEACYQRGDIVQSIDGVPAEQTIEDMMPYLSGTIQWKSFRALSDFGLGLRNEPASLILDREGRTVSCDVDRTFSGRLEEERPDSIAMIQPDIYYVDLGRAEIGAIQEHMESLAQAKGVIFDLRGYPKGNHAILQHLTDEPIQSAYWQVPQIIYPDQKELVGYDTSGRWTLFPSEPRITGRIVFLTSGRAISYAESVMGIVEHYKLGEIVGQPTAGANGNINPFQLPGGYNITWTGMRVIKHDDSQHHLIGIQPTIPLERTLEGVREGRDEYIERALDIIQDE